MKKIRGFMVIIVFAMSVLGMSSVASAEETGRTIQSVEITSTKNVFTYQSTVGASDFMLLVRYSDGTTASVNPDSGYLVDTQTIGTQKIFPSYQGASTSLVVTVVPRQPADVAMRNGTADSMTISWTALAEAKKYEVYTAKTENGTYTLKDTTEKPEYTFTNLAVGEIVYVKIRATSGEFFGEFSPVTPVAAKPSKVAGVVATKCYKTQMNVVWNPVEGASGYIVKYRLASSSTYETAGSTTGTTYNVTGLSSGENYYIVVYAYVAVPDNIGDASDEVMYGTATAIPVISSFRGGDKCVKLNWNKVKSAERIRIYLSTSKNSGYIQIADITYGKYRLYRATGLLQKKKYYVKIEAVRNVSGMELVSTSVIKNATTKAAKATSRTAKYYKTKSKFKKSAAYKKYKTFRKKVVYSKCYIVPGMKVTNVGGFNSTRMVPQGVTFAGNYMLITAYDYTKKEESVIYIVNKSTRKYVSTIVLPHKGHVGGVTFDGVNLWVTYGSGLQCIKYATIVEAATNPNGYQQMTDFAIECPTIGTAAYVTYYKGMVWVGSYSEKYSRYLYGYAIGNKTGAPTLTATHKILLPNRTQGVTFTSTGKMIVSQSCQTRKGKSGFISRLLTYKPTWNMSVTTIKKNKQKRAVSMPPMNEGITVSGSYTYVIYESPAFGDCQAPMDRVTAFKTSKIC